MTSTPLIPIEGAFALPHLRALDHLPEPFGRDWTLLSGAQRWRTGLDSLYAALLRTVCIRDQQLLSYGQRVSIDGVLTDMKLPAETPVANATQPAGEPSHTATAAHPAMQRKVPQGPMRIALKARSPRIAQRRTVRHRRTVAASAGVIGCVAVLAWWIVDQPPAPWHMASDMLKSAQALMPRRDAPAPVEKRRVQHLVASPEAPVIAEAVTPAPVLPPLPVDVAAAAPTRIAALPQRTATRHAPTPRDAIYSSPPRRALRVQTHPLPVNRHAANDPSHEARVRARFGEDGYADMTTFAMMSLRDVALLPRSTVSNNLPANSTEWMNLISQRRVTEIPERFAQ
ncbi:MULTISPECIES: hypothetical protein [unclassified Paraburkholderia]|uniref:hypothetical protein n=1 Tax=unclassified Paraburkholderia TaxID=2615204 RepID=UPI00160BE725|nr:MULTISPECIES: hypothetical protein [unclassified Paraburkholderia]MBB5447242.1 hypothetical protein [Paraburkholderia sp. WSM4177]MBB5487782.1 hypothetical protein [Paraburkholderia sp. WSM4180]